MSPTPAVLCFGELLLRLGAPGQELLLSSPNLSVHHGGAEANVAVALAHLGHPVRMLSVVPDNALGRGAVAELRRHGVDTRAVLQGHGRMGLYFFETGAMQRPSQVLYDRADSAFARNSEVAPAWSGALAGAAWLHLSGINPALGEGPAKASLELVRQARANGLQVSFDGNYRSRLWSQRAPQAPAVLAALLEHATLLFGDHRDLELVLGESFAGDDSAARTRAAAVAAFARWPQLERVVCTLRQGAGSGDHALGALLCRRDGHQQLPALPLHGVVDRIGAGDAFAAGVLHGLLGDADELQALRLGLAAGCLKHSLPGDFLTLEAAALESFLQAGGQDVQR